MARKIRATELTERHTIIYNGKEYRVNSIKRVGDRVNVIASSLGNLYDFVESIPAVSKIKVK